MDINNLIEIGRIKKPHGKDGKLIIQLVNELEFIKEKLVFVIVQINKRYIPYFVTDYSIRPDSLEVKFEDIDTPESASKLSGNYAFVENPEIFNNLANYSSFRDLVGFQVKAESEKFSGTIEEVLERPEQALLKINHNDREVLIPAANEFIGSIDKQNKIIYLNIPPGLIEINS